VGHHQLPQGSSTYLLTRHELCDFQTDRMIELVTHELGGWAPAHGQPPSPPSVPNSATPSPAAPPQILLLDKPGATQASVVMGELGTTLADPDVYSLDALNECASLSNISVRCPVSSVQSSSSVQRPVCKPWSSAGPRARSEGRQPAFVASKRTCTRGWLPPFV